MPIALQGAVFTKQEGQRITYKKKCEKCGTVSQGTVQMSISANAKTTSFFRCGKCNNNQKVEIQG